MILPPKLQVSLRWFVLSLLIGSTLLLFHLISPAKARTNYSKLAVTYQNFEYQEPGLMEETGSLYGLQGRFLNRQGKWSHGLKGEFTLGELTYDGQTQTGTPLSAPTEDRIYKGEYFVGPNVRGEDWITTPFAGIGYRYWFDDIKHTAGYRRKISYLYFPLGVFVTPRSENFLFQLQYNNFGSGTVTSHLEDALDCPSGGGDPPGTPLEKNLSEGEGLSARLEFYPNRKWSFETYLRRWAVEDSDVARVDTDCNGTRETGFFEPANETSVVGFSLGRSF